MNPFKPHPAPDSEKLYGAIVAQARLPVFYQTLGVPDTLEGRFVALSLHLFAVHHRLTAEGAPASDLAQDLADRFAADMDTVLREIGVGDLAVPKKVRGIAAVHAALLESFARALALDDATLAAAIESALPSSQRPSGSSSLRLAHYVRNAVSVLAAQDLAALAAGEVRFAETGWDGGSQD